MEKKNTGPVKGEYIARFSVCSLFLRWQFWSLMWFEYFLSTRAEGLPRASGVAPAYIPMQRDTRNECYI